MHTVQKLDLLNRVLFQFLANLAYHDDQHAEQGEYEEDYEVLDGDQ